MGRNMFFLKALAFAIFFGLVTTYTQGNIQQTVYYDKNNLEEFSLVAELPIKLNGDDSPLRILNSIPFEVTAEEFIKKSNIVDQIDVDRLYEYSHQFVYFNGKTLKKKFIVLVITKNDLDSDYYSAILSTMTHTVRGNMILVCHGCFFQEELKQFLSIFLQNYKWASFIVLEIAESSADMIWVHKVMEQVPKNAIAAFIPASILLVSFHEIDSFFTERKTNVDFEGYYSKNSYEIYSKDLFMAYEKLAFEYDSRGSFLVKVDVHNSNSQSMPVLLFDKESYEKWDRDFDLNENVHNNNNNNNNNKIVSVSEWREFFMRSNPHFNDITKSFINANIVKGYDFYQEFLTNGLEKIINYNSNIIKNYIDEANSFDKVLNSWKAFIPRLENFYKTEASDDGTYQHTSVVNIENDVDSNMLFQIDNELQGSLCGPPAEFLILIIGEGIYDTYTAPIFEDIAYIIKEGLESLGYNAKISYCGDLRFCKMVSQRFMLILGIHHLARYTDPNNIPVAISGNFFHKCCSILYNFEHIAGQEDYNSESDAMYKILEYFSPHIWDYNIENINILTSKGIKAHYVPVGYPNNISNKSVTEYQKDIDVLFYGRLNSYRKKIIQDLRSGGLNVLHANAIMDVYGNRLDVLVLHSKIVLNLNYFNENDEWKMTRFIKPLTREVLIISEISGNESQRKFWHEGIVFVEKENLLKTCKYYIQNESERKNIAKIGHQLYKSIKEDEIVDSPLSSLIENTCSNDNHLDL